MFCKVGPVNNMADTFSYAGYVVRTINSKCFSICKKEQSHLRELTRSRLDDL